MAVGVIRCVVKCREYGTGCCVEAVHVAGQLKPITVKAWRHWDSWLGGRNEAEFIEALNGMKRGQRYEVLQEFVGYLGGKVGARTVRDYFDRVFKWLVLSDADLDYTQKRIRITLPRVAVRRFGGLDREMIRLELKHCSKRYGLYLRVLAGSGMRETEALMLTPAMVQPEEPVRLALPGEITKFGIPRETFLPPKTAALLAERITAQDLGADDPIFVRNFGKNSLLEMEKQYSRIRKAAGLETPNRRPHQQHDITLHSHRAFFISSCVHAGYESYGHALTGHASDMRAVYYRTTLAERQAIYRKIERLVDFG